MCSGRGNCLSAAGSFTGTGKRQLPTQRIGPPTGLGDGVNDRELLHQNQSKIEEHIDAGQ